MFLSRYHLTFPHPQESELLLLYSTRTTALVVLDQATYTALAAGEPVEGSEALVECGLMVEDLTKEREEVLTYLDQVNEASTHLSVAVILGMACNFACTYCYEGADKGAAAMDERTLERLPEFLLDQCGPGCERIGINFYGGEPLLYPERIKKISSRMQELCEEGLAYDFVLVSNGSLLRPELVKELLPYGLTAVKITLDGPPDIHDQCRPLRNGAPTFATILTNIRDCADLVTINLGGNYSKASYGRFPELLQILQDNNLTPETMGRLRFNPVIQPEPAQASPFSFHGGCQSTGEPWLIEAAISLRGQLLKHGWDPAGITPTPCMVDRDDSFTVHHDGSIYQCPALVGRSELACGDIWNGMTDYRKQYQVKNWQDHATCRDCLYLLLCFGGCRFMKYSKDGTMDIDCRKTFLEATLPTFAQQDILAAEEAAEAEQEEE